MIVSAKLKAESQLEWLQRIAFQQLIEQHEKAMYQMAKTILINNCYAIFRQRMRSIEEDGMPEAWDQEEG